MFQYRNYSMDLDEIW